MTAIEDFLTAREAERAWAFANGFNNGDPDTNGEFACLAMLLESATVLLDIGANEGLFVERAARLKPDVRIVAFEPNPAHADGLRARLAPVKGRLEAIALSDTAGTAVLHVHDQHHATASLSGRPRMTHRFRQGMTQVEAAVRRLDDVDLNLAADDGVVMKIDTEGFEFPVLRGAAEFLTRPGPVAIILEHSFAWLETGESLIDCFNFLDARGFDFYRLLPIGLERVRFFSADMEQAQYCNYVALKGVGLDEARTRRLATKFGATDLHLFDQSTSGRVEDQATGRAPA